MNEKRKPRNDFEQFCANLGIGGFNLILISGGFFLLMLAPSLVMKGGERFTEAGFWLGSVAGVSGLVLCIAVLGLLLFGRVTGFRGLLTPSVFNSKEAVKRQVQASLPTPQSGRNGVPYVTVEQVRTAPLKEAAARWVRRAFAS